MKRLDGGNRGRVEVIGRRATKSYGLSGIDGGRRRVHRFWSISLRAVCEVGTVA